MLDSKIIFEFSHFACQKIILRTVIGWQHAHSLRQTFFRTNWINIMVLVSVIFEVSLWLLPNQELSVLYGGPTLNYGGQLSLYLPYMLRENMTWDLAHLQLSDLQGETRPICRASDLKGNVCLYAERNGHFPYWNNLKRIVSLTSICIFSSYFLFVDASLIKMRK